MGTQGEAESLDTHEQTRGRTLLELEQQPDGTWLATQYDVDVEGTGETGALAAVDYCRKIAEGIHEQGE
jgi:hypothetical protein